jgi:hypothetical protein
MKADAGAAFRADLTEVLELTDVPSRLSTVNRMLLLYTEASGPAHVA